MFTREELEHSWNNDSYGVFTKLVKDIKNKKPYKVTVKVCEEILLDCKEINVWANNGDEAISQVRSNSSPISDYVARTGNTKVYAKYSVNYLQK